MRRFLPNLTHLWAKSNAFAVYSFAVFCAGFLCAFGVLFSLPLLSETNRLQIQVSDRISSNSQRSLLSQFLPSSPGPTDQLSMWQIRSNLRGLIVLLIGLLLLASFSKTNWVKQYRLSLQEQILQGRKRKQLPQLQELLGIHHRLKQGQNPADTVPLKLLSLSATKHFYGDRHIAAQYASVTVLFADLVNFTQLAEELSPRTLVTLLNEIFSRFDLLAERYGLEKIKSVGDTYMVAGGLPGSEPNHAWAIAQMALAMRADILDFNAMFEQNINIRIGIHTGPVAAGMIGKTKLVYDLWGDTVNVASRMESHGVVGEIQMTELTHDCLYEVCEFEARGEVNIKGKGPMKTFLLKRCRQARR